MKKVIFCIRKTKKQNKDENKNKNKHAENKSTIFKLKKQPLKSKWTKQEDEVLFRLSQRMKRNKWKFSSLILKNKSSYQCYLRYKKINPTIIKGRWSTTEDRQLLELVGIFGKSWKSIAKIMKTRTNKQIRNRYEEHLAENLNKGIFSKEEDDKLISLYSLLEDNWFRYKEYFPDRSIKKIKNRINYLIHRQKRIKKKNKNISNFLSVTKADSFKSLSSFANSSHPLNLFTCKNNYNNINNNDSNPYDESIKENLSTSFSIEIKPKRLNINKSNTSIETLKSNFFNQGNCYNYI